MNYRYCAYGLNIQSDLPLPELVQETDSQNRVADVHIQSVQFDVPPHVLSEATYVQIAPHETLLFARGVGTFKVQEGQNILVQPDEGASAKAVRLFLLGPALSMLLHQRGNLVMHASSVALAGPDESWSGIAFLGDSGQGKSTMGAALFERGHRAIADDNVPLALEEIYGDGEISLLAGFPVFKLWPESVEALYEDVDALPYSLPEAENYPRRERKAERNFQLEPVPLRALFILQTSAAIECVRLPLPEALMALVKNSYWVAEFDAADQAVHFEQCVKLAQRVPVYYLRRPRDLSRLSDVAQVVETLVSTELAPASRAGSAIKR